MSRDLRRPLPSAASMRSCRHTPRAGDEGVLVAVHEDLVVGEHPLGDPDERHHLRQRVRAHLDVH